MRSTGNGKKAVPHSIPFSRALLFYLLSDSTVVKMKTNNTNSNRNQRQATRENRRLDAENILAKHDANNHRPAKAASDDDRFGVDDISSIAGRLTTGEENY